MLFTKTNSGGNDHVWFYDVMAHGYDLSLNHYKEVIYEELEQQIQQGIKDLDAMLK